GLCRVTDATIDDGTLTGGTYVYEENTAICDAVHAAAGPGGACGGEAWEGIYFYDWDPFNTIEWNADGERGCGVRSLAGQPFGVWVADCATARITWVCEHQEGLLKGAGAV